MLSIRSYGKIAKTSYKPRYRAVEQNAGLVGKCSRLVAAQRAVGRVCFSVIDFWATVIGGNCGERYGHVVGHDNIVGRRKRYSSNNMRQVGRLYLDVGRLYLDVGRLYLDVEQL